MLVSGSIADEIRMNRGICALGPGSISQVNVAIGRALRLIMMNVGLSYPGVSDMDTIGTPMKFSACVAENEERTPWDSWRVQAGFSKQDSTVSVNVPYGMTEFFDFKNHDAELLIETLATLTSQNCGSPAQGVWLAKKNAPLHEGYPFHGKYSNLMLLGSLSSVKPVVIEEMFPLSCSMESFRLFVEMSRESASGWIGFYWGKTLEECRASKDMKNAFMAQWLEYFRSEGPIFKGSPR